MSSGTPNLLMPESLSSESLFLPSPEPFSTHPYHIGTSGFSFRDWRGTFYPLSLPASQHLSYYARHFDVVEINATYYEIPGPRTFDSMVRKTPEGFGFWVKLPGSVTHTGDPPEDDMAKWRRAVEPLRDAQRLRGALAQFPPSFRPSPQSLSRLERVAERAQTPLAVEFRHRSWQDQELYSWLDEKGLILVMVDAPRIGDLPKPEGVATANVGYIRFHGRNAAAWYGKERGDRYNYDYSPDELKEWLPRLKTIAQSAEVTYIFFNNCHAGQAVRSAKMLRDLLTNWEKEG